MAVTPTDIYFTYMGKGVEKGQAKPTAARWFLEQQS
jgi:hypothetical protein